MKLSAINDSIRTIEDLFIVRPIYNNEDMIHPLDSSKSNFESKRKILDKKDRLLSVAHSKERIRKADFDIFTDQDLEITNSELFQFDNEQRDYWILVARCVVLQKLCIEQQNEMKEADKKIA